MQDNLVDKLNECIQAAGNRDFDRARALENELIGMARSFEDLMQLYSLPPPQISDNDTYFSDLLKEKLLKTANTIGELQSLYLRVVKTKEKELTEKVRDKYLASASNYKERKIVYADACLNKDRALAEKAEQQIHERDSIFQKLNFYLFMRGMKKLF